MSHNPPSPATAPHNNGHGNGLSTQETERPLSWRVAANLLISFRYAGDGLRYAFLTQRNFRIHVGLGSLVFGLACWLGLTRIEFAVLALTIGAVMGTELINTALESVVDLTVEQNYHDLARIAKDCAAGAVLVASLASVIVALTLLLPPLLQRVGY
ncbi:MAG: diacylglycerol kinase family protein [Cyanobacteria bacterium P01_H01_bin.121]